MDISSCQECSHAQQSIKGNKKERWVWWVRIPLNLWAWRLYFNFIYTMIPHEHDHASNDPPPHNHNTTVHYPTSTYPLHITLLPLIQIQRHKTQQQQWCISLHTHVSLLTFKVEALLPEPHLSLFGGFWCSHRRSTRWACWKWNGNYVCQNNTPIWHEGDGDGGSDCGLQKDSHAVMGEDRWVTNWWLV